MLLKKLGYAFAQPCFVLPGTGNYQYLPADERAVLLKVIRYLTESNLTGLQDSWQLCVLSQSVTSSILSFLLCSWLTLISWPESDDPDLLMQARRASPASQLSTLRRLPSKARPSSYSTRYQNYFNLFILGVPDRLRSDFCLPDQRSGSTDPKPASWKKKAIQFPFC